MSLMTQRMPWEGRFPAWAEAVAWVRKQEHRFWKRGGKISGVRMNKATWLRLCDQREARYRKDNEFGRPGQRHYDSKKFLSNPLNLDPDTPYGHIWVDGS